jgi:hypothetical protein
MRRDYLFIRSVLNTGLVLFWIMLAIAGLIFVATGGLICKK